MFDSIKLVLDYVLLLLSHQEPHSSIWESEKPFAPGSGDNGEWGELPLWISSGDGAAAAGEDGSCGGASSHTCRHQPGESSWSLMWYRHSLLVL